MQLTLRQWGDWVAHVLKAATQQHHQELRPLFAPYIPADAVIVDIGAHAGQFSRLFARMAPQGHVYAFEPSAYARSVMQTAMVVNRADNITLTPKGLSDAPGELVLHTPIKKAGGMGFGAAYLGEAQTTRAAADQTVVLTTLDAFAAEAGLTRLDFIKADVEGWELHALRGAEATLRRFHPALYLEVSDEHLSRAGGSAAGLFAWLADLGYSARRVPAMTPAAGYDGPANYLFVAAA